MSNLLKQYSLTVCRLELILLPAKVVWVPAHATLLLADTHFGKAAAFRKSGIPVPAGTTKRMLQQISVLLSQLGAETLIVLGDLVHSSISAQRDFEDELAEWRRLHSQVNVVLLRGNHDQRNTGFYDRLGIEIHDNKTRIWNSIELCHDPKDASSESFSLCGHIHPAVKLNRYKLPCFWLRSNQLVLPAFGEFTGLHAVDLDTKEAAFAICDQSLAIVSYSRH